MGDFNKITDKEMSSGTLSEKFLETVLTFIAILISLNRKHHKFIAHHQPIRDYVIKSVFFIHRSP